jgi:hypothetical protein
MRGPACTLQLVHHLPCMHNLRYTWSMIRWLHHTCSTLILGDSLCFIGYAFVIRSFIGKPNIAWTAMKAPKPTMTVSPVFYQTFQRRLIHRTRNHNCITYLYIYHYSCTIAAFFALEIDLNCKDG